MCPQNGIWQENPYHKKINQRFNFIKADECILMYNEIKNKQDKQKEYTVFNTRKFLKKLRQRKDINMNKLPKPLYRQLMKQFGKYLQNKIHSFDQILYKLFKCFKCYKWYKWCKCKKIKQCKCLKRFKCCRKRFKNIGKRISQYKSKQHKFLLRSDLLITPKMIHEAIIEEFKNDYDDCENGQRYWKLIEFHFTELVHCVTYQEIISRICDKLNDYSPQNGINIPILTKNKCTVDNVGDRKRLILCLRGLNPYNVKTERIYTAATDKEVKKCLNDAITKSAVSLEFKQQLKNMVNGWKRKLRNEKCDSHEILSILTDKDLKQIGITNSKVRSEVVKQFERQFKSNGVVIYKKHKNIESEKKNSEMTRINTDITRERDEFGVLSLYWGIHRWRTVRPFCKCKHLCENVYAKFFGCLLSIVISPFVLLIQACAFVLYSDTNQFGSNEFISFILQNIKFNVDHIEYFDFFYAFSKSFAPDPQFRRNLPQMVKGSNAFNDPRNAKMGDIYVSKTKWQIIRLISAVFLIFLTTIIVFNCIFYLNTYDFKNRENIPCISSIELISAATWIPTAALMVGSWYSYSVAIRPRIESSYGIIQSETMKLKYLEMQINKHNYNYNCNYKINNNTANDVDASSNSYPILMQTNIATFLQNSDYYYSLYRQRKRGFFRRPSTAFGVIFGILFAILPGMVRLLFEKDLKFFDSQCKIPAAFGLIINLFFAILQQYIFLICVYYKVKDYLKLMKNITHMIEIPYRQSPPNTYLGEKWNLNSKGKGKKEKKKDKKNHVHHLRSHTARDWDLNKIKNSHEKRNSEPNLQRNQTSPLVIGGPNKIHVQSQSQSIAPSNDGSRDGSDNEEKDASVAAGSPSIEIHVISEKTVNNKTVTISTKKVNTCDDENSDDEVSLLYTDDIQEAGMTSGSDDNDYDSNNEDDINGYMTIESGSDSNSESDDDFEDEDDEEEYKNGSRSDIFVSFDDPENLVSWMEIRDHTYIQGMQIFGDLEAIVAILGSLMVIMALRLCHDILFVDDFIGETRIGLLFTFIITVIWILQVMFLGFKFDSLQGRQINAMNVQLRCILLTYQDRREIHGYGTWVSLQCRTWDKLHKHIRSFNRNPNNSSSYNSEFDIHNRKFNQHLDTLKFFIQQIQLKPLNPKIFGVSLSGTLLKTVIASVLSPFVLFIIKNSSS